MIETNENTYKKRNRIFKLIDIVVTIFLCIIIFILIVQRYNLSQGRTNLFNFNVVISDSMTPTIPTGSLVGSKITKRDSLKKGDIITFKANNTIVTHRIYSIDKDKIITKGDANNKVDDGTATNILGKVYFYVPMIGYFFLSLQNPMGKIALIMTIGTYWLLKKFLKLLWSE